jgi:hypothetical protein
MPYPELVLSDAPPPGADLPNRADVALFVGLVPRRSAAVPANVRRALEAAGWAGSGLFARSDEAVEALLDVPVAVTSWDAFDALFGWDTRLLAKGGARRLACPLGLAVRSFFTEGGAKAWIVRTGDPLPLLPDPDVDEAAVRAEKRHLVSWKDDAPPDATHRVTLIPGLGAVGTPASAGDPATWHGAAHIWGIDDAAMLSLPDLVELFAPPPAPLASLPAPPPVPENFKPCAVPVDGLAPEPRVARPHVTAPRYDRAAYGAWSGAIKALLDMLDASRRAGHRRDVMLMASLPLPRTDLDLPGLEGAPLRLLDEPALGFGGLRLRDRACIGSARLQLGYPWVATAVSAAQPEGVELPEGVLMGAVARSALTFGAFASAASTPLPSVGSTVPELRGGEVRASLAGGAADWTGDRLCLVGRRLGSMALISDATMSESRDWRAGGVSRLMGVILRASRWLGQDRLYEPSGPRLWAELRLDLESFLDRLWRLGALSGATAARAYTVRCDETTMRQADIDAGRTIVSLAFTAAQPIQRIEVTLSLADAGVLQMAEAA